MDGKLNQFRQLSKHSYSFAIAPSTGCFWLKAAPSNNLNLSFTQNHPPQKSPLTVSGSVGF